MLSELKTKLHSLFGSDFISQVEQNFETIKSWADKKITSTKTMLQIKNAHKSSQIKHTIKVGKMLTYRTMNVIKTSKLLI